MTATDVYDEHCISDGQKMTIIYNYVVAPIEVATFLFVAWITYLYVQNWRQSPANNPKASKILFRTGMAFLIMELLYFITAAGAYFTRCNEALYGVYSMFYLLSLFLFLLDYLVIWLLFYLRLHYMFLGTAFAISARTNKLFWAAFASVLFCAIAVVICNAARLPFGLILAMAAFLFVGLIVGLCSLLVAFLRKLVAVYHHSGLRGNEKDRALRAIITCSSMLACISLSWTLVSFCIMLAAIPYDHIEFRALMVLVILGDKISNVVGITYSYDGFNDIYIRCCGCCDRQWSNCWARIAGEDEVNLQQAVNGSTGSTAVQKKAGVGQISVASNTDGPAELSSMPSSSNSH